jgi:hypothetical protein
MEIYRSGPSGKAAAIMTALADARVSNRRNCTSLIIRSSDQPTRSDQEINIC